MCNVHFVSVHGISKWQCLNVTLNSMWSIRLCLHQQFVTHRRSIMKRGGCFQQCVCLSVCLFVNTITSTRLNAGWWDLPLGALYKNLTRVRIWGVKGQGHSPGTKKTKKCGIFLRSGPRGRELSSASSASVGKSAHAVYFKTNFGWQHTFNVL